MSKINTVIIDDEPLAREIVKAYLKNFPEIEIAAECDNGFQGIKAINEFKPDLIFLDVQMPKINGFEMLELLEELPVVIFTTAYDQYALKAFEANAADYLLKPFSEERFSEAISKASFFLADKKRNEETLGNVFEQMDKKKEFLERVVVKNGPRIHIIPADKISFIEAQDDYVMINTAEGRFLKQKTMKFFEDHLNPEEFIRIHRSFLVRLSEIKQIELFEKETYRVQTSGGKFLPVSKSGYSRLKEIFQ
ncbi:MAG: LytR/AlgR family response regulator transcription factor [Bacteroidota bacterium]|jgi:two-component system LytT family response regulator|nr:response regulator [Ignavibacteria bacterium]HEX2963796.1 response regulator [Ignavibacteriales bacterium]MCU7499438.1 response regulator [Ignavibacteria bacterium]MCU7512730.1 response regulator [Ignavibacteria bacterium]MCU7521841.1 response regulator [Ignavibacteria bacterium]